jgi:hypothetical protein
METFNLFHGATSGDESDPPGFRARSAQLGPMLGAARLGMMVYELPPGEAICPYHFHWGDEEWLIVVAGTPTLRTPEGETARNNLECSPWAALNPPRQPPGFPRGPRSSRLSSSWEASRLPDSQVVPTQLSTVCPLAGPASEPIRREPSALHRDG